MQDKRRHKRFKLDLIEINGKMSLADKVEIIDISLGGVALKADRRLNIGKEISIKLGEKGKSIDVKGIVVRSELSGIEERANGQRILIYQAGMKFKDGSADKIADFLKSIEHNRKEKVPTMVDRRLNVRFEITTPSEQTLSFPAQFTVRNISLSGMLIQTDQTLGSESVIPMGLSFSDDSHVNFSGRVASCRKMEEKGQEQYEIGVEFLDLTDKDRTLLKTFIDFLASMDSKVK
ncbi:MAG: PilZ domain-containing protein [Betaproteobacteria bacterium]